jgi:peptidoglycan hydrolase CwlO-like protein
MFKMQRWKHLKRVLAILMIFISFIFTVPFASNASQSTKDKLNEAKQAAEEAKNKVSEQQDEVDDLTEQKSSLKKELNTLNTNMEELAEKIEDISNQISAKETEISETEDALAEAKEIETTQYEAMKNRIKFMYMDSESLYMEIIFKAANFSSLITLNDYVDSLAAYDRKKLTEYQETRQAIEELEAKLIGEKEELDELKAEAEADREELDGVISSTQSSFTKYSNLLDDAEEELLAYEAELDAKNADVETLQKQLEEELRLTQLANQSAWRDISEVTFEENDRYLLAVLIYCEAGGEPYEGQVAVGAVVINRVLSSVYPNTVSGVIYQKSQFSPVGSGRLAYYMSIGKVTQSCYNAADAAMSGVTNVGNCLHFRTPIPGLSGIQIGNHIFY